MPDIKYEITKLKRLSLLLFTAIIATQTSCGRQNPPEDAPTQEIAAAYTESAARVYGITEAYGYIEAAEDEEASREQEPTEPIEEYSPRSLARVPRTRLVTIGETIEFGGYSWVVLDVKDNYALVITEHAHILRGGGYWHDIWGPITWEASSIRRYLNDTFYNRFSAEDRKRIRLTYIENNDNPWDGTDRWFNSTGGENTMDKIFFLSVREVVRYFGDSGQMDDRPDNIGALRIIWISDEYDYGRIGRDETGTALSWWLRTPGAHQRLVTFIDPIGSIAMYGTSSPQTPVAARPALWLSLECQAEHQAPDWDNFAWTLEHFDHIRAPLRLDSNTPHGDLAIQHLEFISDNLYSRIPFSYREKEAAAWLVEELLAMGHHWGNIQVQEVPLLGDMRWWNLNNQPMWASDMELRETTRLTQNVIATIPGQSQRKIIVGAHYDSYPTPGASDNASETSVLLESAQRMLQMNNYYTIKYVFFGAHEIGGFVTTDAFISSLTDEQLNDIVLMVNVDNILDGPYMFYGAAYNDDWQPGSNAITQRIDAIAYELDSGLIGHPPAAFLYSDQFSFLARGHTVVFMMGLFGVEHPGVVGFFEIDGKEFVRGVSHTQNDDFHVIEARWPGMIQRNMHVFSVFLEGILTGL